MPETPRPTFSPTPIIVVSSLFFYREDLAVPFLAKLWPQLVSASAALGTRISLKVTLNYPATTSYADGLIKAVAGSALPGGDVTFELLQPGWNAGFGSAHNAVFADSDSDFFVILNSDLFCEQDDWLPRLLQAFEDPAVSIAGPAENAAALRPSDGCGLPAVSPEAVDFVDGSLLAFRSATARRLGLFHPAYRHFYFEDSDLCFRYRQAGYKIATRPIPHHHLRFGSSTQFPRRVIKRVLDDSRGSFFARWAAYFPERHFHGAVFADLSALPLERLLTAVPALLALTRDHPGAQLYVNLPDGPRPWWFQGSDWQLGKPGRPVDRLWTAPAPQPGDSLPATLRLLASLGSEPNWESVASLLRLACGNGVKPNIESRKAIFLIPPIDPQFPGLNASPVLFRPAIDWLLEEGWTVILVGVSPAAIGPTSHPSLLSAVPTNEPALVQLLASASCVVAPAGPVLELAQLLHCRTLAICGAISPLHAIFAWNSTMAFTASLDCIGCHALYGALESNTCLRQDIACLHPSNGAVIKENLRRLLAGESTPLAPALLAEQRRLLQPSRPSDELDLSRWPAN